MGSEGSGGSFPTATRWEVNSAARILGTRPDKLASIRVPGPGQIGESVLTLQLPRLQGFEAEARDVRVAAPGDPRDSRFATLYTKAEDRILIVSHESGPEIFFDLLQAGAAGVAALDGVVRLVGYVRRRRAAIPSAASIAHQSLTMREYRPDGSVMREITIERDERLSHTVRSQTNERGE
jgi:hypothetical protein